MTPVFCLLTDFGLEDHYVGTMKGVLLSGHPQAQIIDITHNVPAQNIRAAAYELMASFRYQPAESVFLCVVDPGVGTDRPILLARAGFWWFIAPDNGLLSWIFESVKPTELYRLRIPKEVSTTFHGRDIMAPAAVELKKGVNAAALGTATDSFHKIPLPVVLKHGSMWQGEVLAVDVFGNLITNLKSEEVRPLARSSKVWFEFDDRSDTIRGLSANYASVDVGKPCAVEGSGGLIEIAINQGSAADVLKLAVGDRVTIHFRT